MHDQRTMIIGADRTRARRNAPPSSRRAACRWVSVKTASSKTPSSIRTRASGRIASSPTPAGVEDCLTKKRGVFIQRHRHHPSQLDHSGRHGDLRSIIDGCTTHHESFDRPTNRRIDRSFVSFSFSFEAKAIVSAARAKKITNRDARRAPSTQPFITLVQIPSSSRVTVHVISRHSSARTPSRRLARRVIAYRHSSPHTSPPSIRRAPHPPRHDAREPRARS